MGAQHEGTQKMANRTRSFILAGALGVLGLVVHFALPVSSAGTLIGDAVFLGMVVLVILSGMDAKRHQHKALIVGPLLGLIYGGLLGIGDLVYSPHGAAIVKTLQHRYPSATQAEIKDMLTLSNTPVARLGALISTVVIWVLLGLLFAWIGTLFVKKSGGSGS